MKWILNYRKVFLIFTILGTLFFVYSLKDLFIEFSFDQFYPDEEPESIYYKSFKERYSDDQSYMISIAVKSPKNDVFDANFLQKVDTLFQSIAALPNLDSCILGTRSTYLKRSGMDYKNIPYLNFDTEEDVLEAKEKLKDDTAFVGMMVTKNHKYICAHLITSQKVFSTNAKDTLSGQLDSLLKSSGFEYYITGMTYIRAQYTSKLRYEAITFTAIGVGLMVILLALVFRNVWIVVITLITVFVGEVWTYGFMASMGQSINLITNLLIPIILVVGVSDILHISTKYLAELKAGHSPEEAMTITLNEIGFATFITCITTATGFASLALSDMTFMKPVMKFLHISYLFGEDIPPFRIFGLYGSFGVFITYIISITLIPNILMQIPPEKLMSTRSIEGSGRWTGILMKFHDISINKWKFVVPIFILILGVSYYGILQIPVNIHLFEELRAGDPVLKNLAFFEKNVFGVRSFDMEIKTKGDHKITDKDVLTEMDKIQSFMQKDTNFRLFLSPVTFIKAANYVYHFNRPKYFAIPDSQSQIAEIMDFAENEAEGNYLSHILTEDRKSGRISARAADLGSEVHKQKMAELEAYMKQNCNMQLFTYQFTGYGYLTEHSLGYLRDNLMNGLIIDFLVIGLVMGLVFRSFRMIILAMIPNLIPLMVTAGLMGFMGITLTASTAIIFVVVFGIAVDDTLHFMSHYKMEIDRGIPKRKAITDTMLGTGKAMILTSVILLSGFGVLTTSSFGGTYSMGVFSLITIIFAVFTDLFLAPFMLYYFGPEKSDK